MTDDPIDEDWSLYIGPGDRQVTVPLPEAVMTRGGPVTNPTSQIATDPGSGPDTPDCPRIPRP
jgi:hypothetical protein